MNPTVHMTFQPPKHFFFLFRICCWVHSVVTLPITKSQYSFIGHCSLQQTSSTCLRLRTMDSDCAAFSPVITHEPATQMLYFLLLSVCFLRFSIYKNGILLHEINPIISQRTMANYSHYLHNDFAEFCWIALILWCISFYRNSGQQNCNDPVGII